MPALIDLRRRIRSVQNTRQITKAMKTVSTAKFRKSQRRVLESRPWWHTWPALLLRAAAWAGLVRAAGVGLVGPTDRVVVISTGSGLKDVASARRAAEEAGAATIEIEADRESLERALADHGIGRGEA